jgi:hypothetical protein
MKGPYLFKLHVYNATKNEWIKNITTYTDKIEWTPSEAGTYVVDLWAMSKYSSLWAREKELNGRIYQAWKLKVITVTDGQTGAGVAGEIPAGLPGGAGGGPTSGTSDIKVEYAGLSMTTGDVEVPHLNGNNYEINLKGADDLTYVTKISLTASEDCSAVVMGKTFALKAHEKKDFNFPGDFGVEDGGEDGVSLYKMRTLADEDGNLVFTAATTDSKGLQSQFSITLLLKDPEK